MTRTKATINSVWKEFEEQKITHSAIHYLFAVEECLEKFGYARAVDISRALSITPGSCSTGLKSLLKKDFIVEDVNKFIKLSAYGTKIVKVVEENRNSLISFFQNTLKLDEDTAMRNACRIEHLLDADVVVRMKNLK
jgi:DtxR family Mn-dependent transcriptional regulator